MGLIGRMKCMAGHHDFGKWSEPSEVDCSQVRKCRRCSKSTSQFAPHDWSYPFYPEAGSCRRQLVCQRCKRVRELSVEHQWLEWTSFGENKCHVVRKCAQCGKTEDGENHPWGVWEYLSPTSCDQVRFCRRCYEGRQVKEPTHGDHRWGEWGLADEWANAERQCLRCGEIESGCPFKNGYDNAGG
jgi:hypothetical protein